MMLATYLHLVPRLRMSGAIPPLPVFAFMAWTRTILLFYIHLSYEACFITAPEDAELSAEL